MNFYVLHLDLSLQSQLQSLLQIDFYSTKIQNRDKKYFLILLFELSKHRDQDKA